MKRILAAVAFLCAFSPFAKADISEFWRYSGGRPEFVGGSKCALPKGEQLCHLKRKGYDVCYSPRLQTCVWVAYSLTPADVSNRVGRVGSFRRDDDLADSAPDPKSYAGSGFDRGHMAPSQDMQYSVEVSRQSFWMGNITPQTPRLNRGEWKKLEGFIHRKVVPNSRGEVAARRIYILTGPIFTKEAIDEFENAKADWAAKGGEGCGEKPPMLRPRAFWKIFKCGVAVDSVIMEQSAPNNSSPVSVKGVSVAKISELTGLSFFGNLSEDLRNFYISTSRPKCGAQQE